MRWTVDTPQDFALVTRIYEHFGHDRFPGRKCWRWSRSIRIGRNSIVACGRKKSGARLTCRCSSSRADASSQGCGPGHVSGGGAGMADKGGSASAYIFADKVPGSGRRMATGEACECVDLAFPAGGTADARRHRGGRRRPGRPHGSSSMAPFQCRVSASPAGGRMRLLVLNDSGTAPLVGEYRSESEQ